MAGSVFGKIAERVYAKNLRFDIRSAIDSTSNVIPPVKAGEMNEAFQVLNSLKVPVQKQFTSKKGQEVWGHTQLLPMQLFCKVKTGPTRISPQCYWNGSKGCCVPIGE